MIGGISSAGILVIAVTTALAVLLPIQVISSDPLQANFAGTIQANSSVPISANSSSRRAMHMGRFSTGMRYLTYSGGKYFYADPNRVRNWAEASQLCVSNGFRPATITSQAQFNALSAAYHYPNFYLGFWTAGRDAGTIRQFAWNTTNLHPPSNLRFINYWRTLHSQTQLCLIFESLGSSSFLYSFKCSQRNWAGTLCEY